MRLSSTFVDLLTCPVSGGKLEYDQVREVLISHKAGLEYPIIDGIPLLLANEAKPIAK